MDKLIAAARELAAEVKERTVAVGQNVAERVEQLRGRFERCREQKIDSKPEQQSELQPGSRSRGKQEQERADPELEPDFPIDQGRKAFRERFEAYKQAKEPTVVPELKPEPVLALRAWNEQKGLVP